MIRNNLTILMAQRGTKISKIYAQTGIARSTLNSIAQNESKMIQLETIDKICQALDVTPCDFFSYLPYEVELKIVPHLKIKKVMVDEGGSYPVERSELEFSFELFIQIKRKEKEDIFSFVGSFQEQVILEYLFQASSLPLRMLVNPETEKDKIGFSTWNNSIPVEFQSDIRTLIGKKINIAFIEELEKNNIDPEYLEKLLEQDIFYQLLLSDVNL